MRRGWSITKNSGGFSAVEALLAATVFGIIVAAIGGALVYSRSSADVSGDRARALALAGEGLEAVRNIRDNSYASLVDGTFGLIQSSNQWALSGASDTSGIYTRQITVASNGANRKTITSKVTWPSLASTSEVTLTSQLTNWMAAIAKLWTNAIQRGAYDASSTNDGFKVATQGNYAYLVRNTGTPNFLVVNISNPASPILAGSLTLTGNPTNITVNGNYAYVTNATDTAELQIVEVTTPTVPVLRGSYNASGAGDGTSVYIIGTTAYVTRRANSATDEFVMVNVTTPTTPTRIGGYGLSVNMNDVYVNGTNVYIVTDSDTQEVIRLTTSSGTPVFSAAVNLSGTVNATTINGYTNMLTVGQGTAFRTVNGLTATVIGGFTALGNVNDITINSANTYAFIGTASTASEFQVVDISTINSPSMVRVVDITGTTSNLTGVAYNASLDVVAGASASDTQELILFGPN